MNNIITLLKKDFLLEFRQKHTFFGILLYIASTIFVVYLTMGQPEGVVWNGMFWIIQLFICVNAVAKSFMQETRGRQLYMYTIASPQAIILSKIIYNVLLMLLIKRGGEKLI